MASAAWFVNANSDRTGMDSKRALNQIASAASAPMQMDVRSQTACRPEKT